MRSSFASIVLLLAIPAVSAQLNRLAWEQKKLYFGTATDNYEFVQDAAYRQKLGDIEEFGQITPSNSMKWFATEPTRGNFTFEGGDQVVQLAQKNRQVVRGHTCAWHSQLAPWVEAGNFSKPELESIVDNHCYTKVKHWQNQIYAWDVVNEAFNEDGTFRESVFYKTIGPSYIDVAFRAARRADPKAKLYINDYNIDGRGPKSTGMINLVKRLQKDRVPIDGIGLQAHLIVGQLPTDIQENIQDFVDLGVEVAITELDIRMPTPATKENLEQQKKDYETVIKACKAVKKCIGVTIWDWTDKYSWVPGVFEGEGAALPWDENLNQKPAYQGIVDGWRKPTPPSPPGLPSPPSPPSPSGP